MQISREQKSYVNQAIKINKQITITKENYAKALEFFLGKITVISPDVQAIVDVMNSEAQKILNRDDFEKKHPIWRKAITDITGIFPYAGRVLQQGASYGALGMGGLTIWAALRNSKLLAAANGCAALALILFSSTINHFLGGLYQHSLTIKNLSLENWHEFEGKIGNNYEKMEKSIFVLGRYYGARKRALGIVEQQALLLLKEEVDAIRTLSFYGFVLMVSYKTQQPLMNSLEQQFDLKKVKKLFLKIEKIASQGKNLTLIGTLLGMAYLYVAYVQRAYLMIIAGLTYTCLTGALCTTARSYQIGAAAIREATEENLLEIYHQNIAGFLIPPVADVNSIQGAIVIPLEKILKLIPV